MNINELPQLPRLDPASVVCGAVGGILAGAVLGHLLARHKVQKQFDGRLDEELRLMQEYFDAKSRRAEAKAIRDANLGAFDELPVADDATDADGEVSPGDVFHNVDNDPIYEGDNAVSAEELAAAGIDASQLAALGIHVPGAANTDDGLDPEEGYVDPDVDDDEDDDEEGIGDEVPAPVRISNKPYLITQAEFEEETEGYRKVTGKYFQSDKTIVDDKNVPIRDFAPVVGADIAEQFGLNPEDPAIVYVQNDRLKLKFEVCLDYSSYAETVLGYGPAGQRPRVVRREQ